MASLLVGHLSYLEVIVSAAKTTNRCPWHMDAPPWRQYVTAWPVIGALDMKRRVLVVGVALFASFALPPPVGVWSAEKQSSEQAQAQFCEALTKACDAACDAGSKGLKDLMSCYAKCGDANSQCYGTALQSDSATQKRPQSRMSKP